MIINRGQGHIQHAICITNQAAVSIRAAWLSSEAGHPGEALSTGDIQRLIHADGRQLIRRVGKVSCVVGATHPCICPAHPARSVALPIGAEGILVALQSSRALGIFCPGELRVFQQRLRKRLEVLLRASASRLHHKPTLVTVL